MRAAFKTLLVLLFAGILPDSGVAQEWHKEDCSNLAIQFDPGGVLSAFGADCWQLQSAKGRLERINARAALSLYVTTLYHVDSAGAELSRSDIRDFVEAVGSFSETSEWSQSGSANGYQLSKFRGTLKIDPYWDTQCIAFSRYDESAGDRFRHQISGFSCIDPTAPGAGFSDTEANDLLSRIRRSF